LNQQENIVDRINLTCGNRLDNIIKNRLARIKHSFFEKKIDTLMVLIEENRLYLSGFTGEDTRFDESAGALFINDNRLILATDSRFELQAENEASLYEVVCYKEGLTQKIPDILNAMKTKRLGFESSRLSYQQHKKIVEKLQSTNLPVEIVATEDIVENLRLIKEEAEIEETKKSLSIAESAFSEFIKTMIPGMTEIEAAWAIEKGMREAGADALSFPTICASGLNSALPHAIPKNRKIESGKPILFDWGARLNGYCSDTSRTVIIGRPDNIFKKVFTAVLDAQRMAIDAIRPGISSKAVDEIARNHIEKMGFKNKFGHGLGHGTGLAVHESPSLSPLKETILEPGMVFTVEPGIYIPGWGGVRLENQVVVRANGAEVLNRLDAANFQVEV
jgi:Xaa-Pro aminopeptidase